MLSQPDFPVPGTAQISDAADVVKRRRLPLEQIPGEDRKLADALGYWQSKRRDGLLPARRDIDILQMRPLIGWTHIVDTRGNDAADYRYRVFGTSIRLEQQRNFRDFRIGDYPSEVYRKMLIEDYSSVAFAGVPSFHFVVAMLNYVAYSYSRLILPMADDGRQVDTLMVCINKRRFSDFAL